MTSELPEHLRAYQTVLYEALAGAAAGLRDASVLDSLARLAQQASPACADDAPTAAMINALTAVSADPETSVALETADALFGSAERFREAVYLARWLNRSPAPAIALAQGRRYVENALVPARYADLLTDHDAVLESTLPSVLWQDQARFEAAVENLRTWRDSYTLSYTRAHADYARALAALAEGIDDLGARAGAVERLNGLRRLGPAVATAALQQFHELERLYTCPAQSAALAEGLRESPVCPECKFTLGTVAPSADAHRVRNAIERGLLSQQRRLAQRVVSRLLEQPLQSESERLERFVQVVQASDLTGLALALDDALIDFLRDFLAPSPPPPGIMDRLAGAFPEVTLANLDAAMTELRRLLAADVVAAGGALRLRQGRDA